MLRHLEDCDLAGNQLAHVEYVRPHRARRSDAAQHSLAPLPTPWRSFASEPNARYSEAVYAQSGFV